MNVVDSMIEIGIWMDGWIFSIISYLYNLIIDLAQYEVFSADSIGSISRKIYALTGIFMLFKVTISMISYVVNPDEFSDKAKGFGGLIKNVFVCLLLIVAVPYIFAEAYYVQKMIINDGTITKIILSGEDSADSSTISLTAKGTKGPGNQIQFILFSQFVKPNTDIDELAVKCKDIYEYVDGKKVIEDGHAKFSDSCYRALDELNVDDSLLQTYIAGMQWSSFKLLSSTTATDLYKTTISVSSNGSSYKARVIAYRWPISTIVGFLVMLILTTMAMDIAVRSIKLGFYQIIAPIPILSSIDPKKGKSGMLQKWAQACVQTYLELFIRLASLFLAVFLIIKLTEDSTFSGMAAVVLIIGALMFAKQLPKLLEDILGFKFNLQLNPVKKIETDALGGKAITGAAAGAAVGTIGALSGAGLLRSFTGAVGGALGNKGFAGAWKDTASNNALYRAANQVDKNPFTRTLGRLGFRASSTLGLPTLSELDTLREKQLDERIKDIDNRIKPVQDSINDRKAFSDKVKAIEDRAKDKIKNGEAGKVSENYKALENRAERLREQMRQGVAGVTENDVARAEMAASDYLNNMGMQDYIDNVSGRSKGSREYKDATGIVLCNADVGYTQSDAAMTGQLNDLKAMVDHKTYHHDGGDVTIDEASIYDAETMHKTGGAVTGSVVFDTRTIINKAVDEKHNLEQEKAELYDTKRRHDSYKVTK